MTAKVHISDGRSGTGNRACVTNIGQVVTGAFSYDLTQFMELAEDDTAYNFYGPKAGEQFVITGIVAKADKQVSATVDAVVIVYEADESTDTTATRVLLEMAMVEGDLAIITPMNVLVNSGKFINGKTTDDDIHMTIMGYYVPIVE